MNVRFLFILILFASPLFGTEDPTLPHSGIYSTLTEHTMRQHPDVAFKQIRRNLNQALDEDDSQAVATAYTQLGELYYHQAAYLQALDNFYKAEFIFRKLRQPSQLGAIWIRIGKTNFYNKQYEVSLAAFEQALALYRSDANDAGMAQALAHIGQAHEKTQNLEEAHRYQNMALAHLNEKDNPVLAAKIYENIGSIHEDRLRLDSALHYFEKALATATDNFGRMEIINNLGDVYRKTGDYPAALHHTRQAVTLAKAMNEQYQLASAYRDLAKTFSIIGANDSAFYYSEASRKIQVNIYSEDNAKQLTVLQTLFELEQKDDAIIRYERERKIHFAMSLFGVAIVLLLVFLGISVFSRQRLKINAEKQLNRQNQKLYATEKRAMEIELHNKKLKATNLRNELELKSKELTSHTLHIIQKNQLLQELKDKLEAVVKSGQRDQRKELKQILNLIQLDHSQDKNWETFRIVFERVHENFFDALKRHNDSLTSSDLRLAALLKMKMHSSDMATMLGISQDSLRVARYRLRKKLHLNEGESLSKFIQKL